MTSFSGCWRLCGKEAPLCLHYRRVCRGKEDVVHESSEELSLESPKRLTMSCVMLLAELSVVLLAEELEDVEVVDDDTRLLSRELRSWRHR